MIYVLFYCFIFGLSITQILNIFLYRKAKTSTRAILYGATLIVSTMIFYLVVSNHIITAYWRKRGIDYLAFQHQKSNEREIRARFACPPPLHIYICPPIFGVCN